MYRLGDASLVKVWQLFTTVFDIPKILKKESVVSCTNLNTASFNIYTTRYLDFFFLPIPMKKIETLSKTAIYVTGFQIVWYFTKTFAMFNIF